MKRMQKIFFGFVLSAFAQKTTGVNPWMNARRQHYGEMSPHTLKADLDDAKRRRVFVEPRL